MKKTLILIFTILLYGCNSPKHGVNPLESATNNKGVQDKQNENIKNEDKARDTHAIQTLKKYLKIKNENENLFIFEILDRENTFITIKVISNEISNNSGSGTVGIYIVHTDESVMEKLIPDNLIGTWSGINEYTNETITYTFTKDNKITINNTTYIINNSNTTFPDNVLTYEFIWDLELFKQMYGDSNIGFGPQAIFVKYHSDTDTIDIGTVLKKVNK